MFVMDFKNKVKDQNLRRTKKRRLIEKRKNDLNINESDSEENIEVEE